jgi:hypothetical protein
MQQWEIVCPIRDKVRNQPLILAALKRRINEDRLSHTALAQLGGCKFGAAAYLRCSQCRYRRSEALTGQLPDEMRTGCNLLLPFAKRKGGPTKNRPRIAPLFMLIGCYRRSYCLSYTCTSCSFAPVAVVPVESTVVTIPSFETVTLDVPIALPSFFSVAK